MLSQILTVTIQAAFLSALSNALAQGITAFQHQKLSLINPTVFLHFVLIALLTTPPNYLWQQFLEDTFPATCPSKKEKSNDGDGMAASEHEKGRLNVANTAVKFLLEQSLGAAANTVIFVIVMGMFKGLSIAEIVLAVRNDVWPMMQAGYKIWPLVTLLNLTIVPLESRILVGNLVGVLWGIYFNLAFALSGSS